MILEIIYQLCVYQRLYNKFERKESVLFLSLINQFSAMQGTYLLSLDKNVFKILILINEFNLSGILKLISKKQNSLELSPQIDQLVQVKINLIKRQQESDSYDQKFLKILYFGNLLFLDKEYKAILDLEVITHISSIYYSQILDSFVYKHVINYVKFVQRFHISLDHTVGNFRNFSLEKVK